MPDRLARSHDPSLIVGAVTEWTYPRSDEQEIRAAGGPHSVCLVGGNHHSIDATRVCETGQLDRDLFWTAP